jgi:hypothetical protein
MLSETNYYYDPDEAYDRQREAKVYKERTCCKCDATIIVRELDEGPSFYCTPCAWSKVGYTYTPDYTPDMERYL